MSVFIKDMGSKCVYMREAYPDLSAEDVGCDYDWGHKHVNSVFGLAWVLCDFFQEELTDVEKVAWFLEDAQSVVDDFGLGDHFVEWEVKRSKKSIPYGVIDCIVINDVEYVLPDSEWEPAVPERREDWIKDRE